MEGNSETVNDKPQDPMKTISSTMNQNRRTEIISPRYRSRTRTRRNLPQVARLLALSLSIGLAGCAPDEPAQTQRGFRLPDGNAELGKQAFVALACNRCHSVEGVDLPGHAAAADASELSLHLGGEIHYVKAYGDLLTSITNPEHLISEKYRAILESNGNSDIRSAMPSFNQRMTVEQLIDIITFLDSRYRLLAPDYSDAIYF